MVVGVVVAVTVLEEPPTSRLRLPTALAGTDSPKLVCADVGLEGGLGEGLRGGVVGAVARKPPWVRATVPLHRP